MSRLSFSIAHTILVAAAVVAAPATWAQPAPVPVQVAEVQTADVPFTLEGIGTVQAFNAVTVRAQSLTRIAAGTLSARYYHQLWLRHGHPAAARRWDISLTLAI